MGYTSKRCLTPDTKPPADPPRPAPGYVAAVAVERFPVEAGHILVFARALGDPNPVYGDEAAASVGETGGIIAPPTFVEAAAHFDPDYALRPVIGRPWFGSGKGPTDPGGPAGEAGAWSALHAEQHYEYHRPVRPGDVLSATSRRGASWERQGRRGGRLRFEEIVTEYRDAQGELVVTARSVEVVTEHVVGS